MAADDGGLFSLERNAMNSDLRRRIDLVSSRLTQLWDSL
jgi:hypothetical protein